MTEHKQHPLKPALTLNIKLYLSLHLKWKRADTSLETKIIQIEHHIVTVPQCVPVICNVLCKPRCAASQEGISGMYGL